MEFGCAAYGTNFAGSRLGRPTYRVNRLLPGNVPNQLEITWPIPGMHHPTLLFLASTHRLLLHTFEAFQFAFSSQAKESTTRWRMWPFHTYERLLQPPSARVEVCRNVMVSAHSSAEKICFHTSPLTRNNLRLLMPTVHSAGERICFLRTH